MIRVRCVLTGPLYHMTIQPKGVRISIINANFYVFRLYHTLFFGIFQDGYAPNTVLSLPGLENSH